MNNDSPIQKATMENIKNHNGLVLLLLSGYRCPPCQKLKQILAANDHLETKEIKKTLKELTKKEILFVMADVQRGELQEWFKVSGARSIPTLVVINNNEYIEKYSPTLYINGFEKMCQEIHKEIELYV